MDNLRDLDSVSSGTHKQRRVQYVIFTIMSLAVDLFELTALQTNLTSLIAFHLL